MEAAPAAGAGWEEPASPRDGGTELGWGQCPETGWGQCPGWGTLALSRAGDRDWGWAMQYRDGTGLGPRDGQGGTEVHWGQCLGLGTVTLTQAGDSAMARHGGTELHRGQGLGLGTEALSCAWDSAGLCVALA